MRVSEIITSSACTTGSNKCKRTRFLFSATAVAATTMPVIIARIVTLSRLLTALLGNESQKSLPSNPLLGKPRPAGRPAGGRSSRTVAGGARGVSGAEKKII